eukprot:TRINITY_DN9517_c0_g1_i1.p1 TRINITY_DN9517_c0_g1~~TRINITY_DN9517_c0_g1_i1.p1  ORF type:complete len:334 (+),score=48.42 TRINITY_DN9517_c0_g1_i1:110-1003(+)
MAFIRVTSMLLGGSAMVAATLSGLSPEYAACLQTNCPASLTYQFPDGWGMDAATDLKTIEGDSVLQEGVRCACSKCADGMAESGWQAYPDACYQVGAMEPPAEMCVPNSCPQALNWSTPQGWGADAAADLATIARDPLAFSIIKCACINCADSYLATTGWPAYPEACERVGVPDVPPSRAKPADSMPGSPGDSGAPTCGQVAMAYQANGCCKSNPNKEFKMSRRLVGIAAAEGDEKELLASLQKQLAELKKKRRQLQFKKDKLGAHLITSSIKFLLDDFIAESAPHEQTHVEGVWGF